MGSSLRSRDIKDYFEADFALLRPDEAITFAMHLYFPASNHIMVWMGSGEVMLKEFLTRYRDRGVNRIWIHRSDEALWKTYIAPKPAPKPEPKTVEAQQIVAALKNPSLPEEQKKAEVAAVAQQVVKKLAEPTKPAEQKKAQEHAKNVVQEVLAGALDKISDEAEEILRISNVEPTFEHALNVSTYSVLFALAFGRISVELLADLALAGLLHDVGLSQIPAHVGSLVWNTHTPEQRKQYSEHVQAGLDLLAAFAPNTSARVLTLLGQHHEKFDGKGYPKGLQGFALDDIAQLVSMADLFDSIGSGRWDGEKRPLGATLDMLDKIEKARTFPENFNPEVFSTVMRWTRGAGSKEQAAAALDVVKSQTRGLLDKKAS